MSDQLIATLRDLHRQLEGLPSLDDQDREMLRQAVSEIQESLDKDDVSSAGLAESLRSTTHQFAEAHPTLARTAGQVADILGQMGI